MNNFLVLYAVHQESGVVSSRLKQEIALPVLEFEQIGMGGLETSTGITYALHDFRGPTNHHLEKFSVHDIHDWKQLKWTKKIPLELKNLHRAFWGLPPVKASKWSPK